MSASLRRRRSERWRTARTPTTCAQRRALGGGALGLLRLLCDRARVAGRDAPGRARDASASQSACDATCRAEASCGTPGSATLGHRRPRLGRASLVVNASADSLLGLFGLGVHDRRGASCCTVLALAVVARRRRRDLPGARSAAVGTGPAIDATCFGGALRRHGRPRGCSSRSAGSCSGRREVNALAAAAGSCGGLLVVAATSSPDTLLAAAWAATEAADAGSLVGGRCAPVPGSPSPGGGLPPAPRRRHARRFGQRSADRAALRRRDARDCSPRGQPGRVALGAARAVRRRAAGPGRRPDRRRRASLAGTPTGRAPGVVHRARHAADLDQPARPLVPLAAVVDGGPPAAGDGDGTPSCASRAGPAGWPRPGSACGAGLASGARREASDLAGQQRLLDLLDRLGDLDAARARLGAVEGRAAAPHALAVVEDLQPQRRRPRPGCRR